MIIKNNLSDFYSKVRKTKKFQSHCNIFDGDMASINFNVISDDFDTMNPSIEMSSPNIANLLYFKECTCR